MASLSNINGKFVVEQTTGNVGIGTTDPDYLLHVNSSDVTNGTRLIIENTNGSGKKYGLIADNTGVFAVRDVTAGADRFSISNLGNATFTGNVTLTTANADTVLTIGNSASGGIDWDIQSASSSSPYAQSSGDLLFRNASSNVLRLGNNGNATFAGNVQAPSVLANGFMEIRSDTAALYFENAANNNYYRLQRSSNDLYLDYYNGSSTTTYTIVSAAGEFWSKALFAGSGTGYRRTYLQEGGFRCTSSADEASTLDIAVDNTKTQIYSNYYSGGSNNDICISTYPPSQNQLYLKNTGNIGIGTDSPSSFSGYTNLSLKAGSTGNNLDFFNSSGTRIGAIVTDGSDDVILEASGLSRNLIFKTDNAGTFSEKMRITSAGGISFGTTGTAYGTSGQVLTSNGNATPTWQAAGGSSPWTTSGNNIYYTTGNVSIGTSSTSFSSSYDNLIVGTGIGDNGIGIYSSSTGNSTLAFLASTGGGSDFEIRVEHDYPFGNMEVYFQHGSDYYLRMFERNNGQDPMIKVGHNNISSFNRGADATMQFRPEQSNWFPAIAINAEDNQGNGRGFIEMISNRSSTFQADYFLKFFNVFSNEIGSIRVNNNNNNVAYNTSSDYRLKEDLKEFKALDTVCKIKVYNYTWKDDPSDFRDQGILAHELDELIPQAVSGEKDALDKDDNILPQSVDYSKIVPHLVQSIQELKAEIEILKNK